MAEPPVRAPRPPTFARAEGQHYAPWGCRLSLWREPSADAGFGEAGELHLARLVGVHHTHAAAIVAQFRGHAKSLVEPERIDALVWIALVDDIESRVPDIGGLHWCNSCIDGF